MPPVLVTGFERQPGFAPASNMIETPPPAKAETICDAGDCPGLYEVDVSSTSPSFLAVLLRFLYPLFSFPEILLAGIVCIGGALLAESMNETDDFVGPAPFCPMAKASEDGGVGRIEFCTFTHASSHG